MLRTICLIVGLLAAVDPLFGQEACTSGDEPFTSPPILKNAEEMRDSLTAYSRREATSLTSPTRVQIGFLIAKDGDVLDLRLVGPSGNPAADSVAIRTARVAEFFPAYLDRQPICKWMVYPFAVSSGRELRPEITPSNRREG